METNSCLMLFMVLWLHMNTPFNFNVIYGDIGTHISILCLLMETHKHKFLLCNVVNTLTILLYSVKCLLYTDLIYRLLYHGTIRT